MSYYLCRKCGHRHEIFAHGGGAKFAAELDVPFLGEIPLLAQIRAGGDTAAPIVVAEPAHPATNIFKSIAAKIFIGLEGERAS